MLKCHLFKIYYYYFLSAKYYKVQQVLNSITLIEAENFLTTSAIFETYLL